MASKGLTLKKLQKTIFLGEFIYLRYLEYLILNVGHILNWNEARRTAFRFIYEIQVLKWKNIIEN